MTAVPGGNTELRSKVFVWFIAVLTCLSLWSENHSDLFGYKVKQWTLDNGLPRNTITAISRSSEGYLWLATDSGLIRFDGSRFRIFNRWNTPELVSEEITCLNADTRQGLWAGTGRGLVHYFRGKWQRFEFFETGFRGPVNAVAETDSGTILVGTGHGLFFLHKGRLTPVKLPAENLGGITGICRIRLPEGDSVLLGTEKGYLISGRNAQTPWRLRGRLADGPVMGFVGIHENTLRVFAGRSLFRIRSDLGNISSAERTEFVAAVTGVVRDSGQNLWLGTETGGVFLQSSAMDRWQAFPGTQNSRVLSMLADGEGNVWFGTEYSGLFHLRKAQVGKLRSQNKEFTSYRALCVAVDRHAVVWTGTRNRGLLSFPQSLSGKTGNRLHTRYPGAVTSLWCDRENGLWLGKGENRILRLDPDRKTVSLFNVPGGGQVRAIYEDSQNVLWAGTDFGLYLLRSREFVHVKIGKSLNRYTVTAIAEDSRGDIWVGTDRGLFRAQNGLWKEVMRLSDSKNPISVTALLPDENGTMWVGTRGWGLMGIRDSRQVVLNSENGLLDNYIFSIQQDNLGYLWVSSYKGVARILQRGLLSSKSTGEKIGIDCMVLNENEGLPGSECSGGYQPSAWITEPGIIYVPTVRGVGVINTGDFADLSAKAAVFIDMVRADNRVVTPDTGVELPRNTRMLEISFSAPVMESHEKTTFQYRLAGFESKWNQARPRQENSAIYLNLDPGSYTFEVKARKNRGTWNNRGSVFSFKIKGRFPWLIYMVLFMTVAVAAGVFFHLQKREKGRRKYKTSALTTDVAEKKLKQLLQVMEEQKLYLNGDLNLNKLADHLHIHYNYLSRIINEHRKQSFNDFLNQYRIEEAKRRLCDPAFSRRTILEIAYDTGFYSKSVFNTAFKKFTGMTPSQYRARKKQK